MYLYDPVLVTGRILTTQNELLQGVYNMLRMRNILNKVFNVSIQVLYQASI